MKKTLTFKQTIAAPRALVWEILWGHETYSKWTAPFCDGSRFEGAWEMGSKMRFLDPDDNGMVSEIAANQPCEFMSIRHLGEIHKGDEDTTSDSVTAWAPIHENYTLKDANGGTELVVESEILASYEDYMLDSFPESLQILKTLCEER